MHQCSLSLDFRNEVLPSLDESLRILGQKAGTAAQRDVHCTKSGTKTLNPIEAGQGHEGDKFAILMLVQSQPTSSPSRS